MNIKKLLAYANQMAKENQYIIDTTNTPGKHKYHRGIGVGISRIIKLIEKQQNN